jgi:hypothetical protein
LNRFLRTVFKVGGAVFLLWGGIRIYRNTIIQPAYRLVSASSPIALQYTNTNGGMYGALVVGGDGPQGPLRTVTRHLPGGGNRRVSLAPKLADDLKAIMVTWCGGHHPVSAQPVPGSYEVVLFCGDGAPLLQLTLLDQDIPPPFAEVDRLVPH